MAESVNTVIIGGGVLGCASAISTQKRLRKINGNNDKSVCLIEKKVITARARVTEKFPVIVALPPFINSKIGIIPNKLADKINKKNVVISGSQTFPSFPPILGSIISFLIKSIKISNKLDNPSGVALIFFLYFLVPHRERAMIKPHTIHNIIICFVIDKSIPNTWNG